MRGFASEAQLASLLVDELDRAIEVVNMRKEMPPGLTKTVSKTFADGIAMWARVLPYMQALLRWEEHLRQTERTD